MNEIKRPTIQIISLQRTGASSLCFAIAATYGVTWDELPYEPVRLSKWRANQPIFKRVIDSLPENLFPEGLGDRRDLAIRMAGKLIRLMPPDTLTCPSANLTPEEERVDWAWDLVMAYLIRLANEVGIVQKTFGLSNFLDRFIDVGMTPIFCSRIFDQYLASHIRLGIAPQYILRNYPGICSGQPQPLLSMMREMRRQPVFSDHMSKTDQFPASCRWLIHSYNAIVASYDRATPVVWTGDPSTKGESFCAEIRSALGKETGAFGSLETNLVTRAIPEGYEEFEAERQNSWNLWPEERAEVEKTESFVLAMEEVLDNFDDPVAEDLKGRLRTEDE